MKDLNTILSKSVKQIKETLRRNYPEQVVNSKVHFNKSFNVIRGEIDYLINQSVDSYKRTYTPDLEVMFYSNYELISDGLNRQKEVSEEDSKEILDFVNASVFKVLNDPLSLPEFYISLENQKVILTSDSKYLMKYGLTKLEIYLLNKDYKRELKLTTKGECLWIFQKLFQKH